MNRTLFYFFCVFTCLIGHALFLNSEVMVLKNNLLQARKGDYIVISTNKTNTLMHIADRNNQFLTIEEVSIPENRTSSQLNWKAWISQNAPGNTSWVMYDLDLQTGQMARYYSFTKRNWYNIPDKDNFLLKLLNLKFTPIPDNLRKKVGPKPTSGPDWRPYWQPKMMFEGRPIKNVRFEAWRTRWPNDGGDLAGRTLEVYLPQDSQLYPAYFPYWLQVNGAVGKAKIRIVDSGTGLVSPKRNFPT